jgi:hypothetical protein
VRGKQMSRFTLSQERLFKRQPVTAQGIAQCAYLVS